MSKLDGSEYIFNIKNENQSLPESYSYQKFLPNVVDQGSSSLCVPYSLSTYLNWNYNVDNKVKVNKDNKISVKDIYNARSNKSKDNGMQVKEALDFLRKTGVKSKVGILKIGKYAKVTNAISLKYAIVMNGPCIGALRVYNEGNTFWKREYSGQEMIGAHAVAIVGYDSEGFIIRNSWGSSYGNGGYYTISYEDSSKFLELWTIYN